MPQNMTILFFQHVLHKIIKKDNSQGYLRDIIRRIRSEEGTVEQMTSPFYWVSTYWALNYKSETMRNTEETDLNEAIL